MSRKFYQDRWNSPAFVQSSAKSLNAVFELKSSTEPVDLRGINVGIYDALPNVLDADFHGLKARQIDASYCKASCSAVGAHLENCNFDDAYFDTCGFQKAVLASTTFRRAKFDSPTFNDAVFRDCLFEKCRITGRGYRDGGGRRVVFENCDFQGALFRNLELRVCTFRNCSFGDASFQKCLLVALRFEGAEPDPSKTVDCEII